MHPTRIFKTPEDLKKAWEEYKEFLKREAVNWPKVQYVGKDGRKVKDYPILPLTMDDFEVFCYNNYGCVNQYFDNKDGYYTDFVTICTYIKKEIRAKQLTGGLLGIYNTSITQRLNNLTEKTESDQKQEVTVNVKYERKRINDNS